MHLIESGPGAGAGHALNSKSKKTASKDNWLRFRPGPRGTLTCRVHHQGSISANTKW